MGDSMLCDGCGTGITEGEVAKGTALRVDGAYYCADCRVDVEPLVGTAKKAGDKAKAAGAAKAPKDGATAKAPKEGTADATGKLSKKPAAAPPADDDAEPAPKPKLKSKPAADEAEAEAPKPKLKPKAGADGEKPVKKAGDKAKAEDGDAAGAKPAKKVGDKLKSKTKPEDDAGDEKPAKKLGDKAKGLRPKSAASGSTDGDPKKGSKKPIGKGSASRARRSESAVSGEGAGAGKKKGPSLAILLGGGGALLFVLIVGIILASSGSSPKATEESKAAAAAAKKEAEDKLSRETLDGVLAKSEGDATGQLAFRREQLRAILEELSASDRKRAEEHLAAAEKKLEEAAEKAFEEAMALKASFVEEKRFGEAVEALCRFPPELRGTKKAKELREEAEKMRTLPLAEREARPLLKKAESYAEGGDFVLAVGTLLGFDQLTYAETPFAEEVAAKRDEYERLMWAQGQQDFLKNEETRLAELKRKKEEEERIARKREDDRIASMRWEEQFGNDLFTFQTPQPNPPEAWKMDKGTLIGTSGGQALMPGIAAAAGTGKSNWKDYLFKVEYKVVRGGFNIGVRATPQGWVQTDLDVKADGQWHEITISVRGMTPESVQEILSGGSTRPIKIDNINDSQAGGIAFLLEPSSEVHFRNLGTKVINKVQD